MSRPLIQLGIDKLEALFVKERKDMEVLRRLEGELQHRQVPRAKSLLAEVQTAIKEMDVAVSSSITGKISKARTPVNTSQPERDLFDSVPLAPSEPSHPSSTESKRYGRPREEGLVIPLSDAYKLLKANSGSSWESIELMRRQLVQRASPAVAASQHKQGLQEEADRVNAAYKVILAARHNG